MPSPPRSPKSTTAPSSPEIPNSAALRISLWTGSPNNPPSECRTDRAPVSHRLLGDLRFAGCLPNSSGSKQAYFAGVEGRGRRRSSSGINRPRHSFSRKSPHPRHSGPGPSHIVFSGQADEGRQNAAKHAIGLDASDVDGDGRLDLLAGRATSSDIRATASSNPASPSSSSPASREP
jgi:hypothetical protein